MDEKSFYPTCQVPLAEYQIMALMSSTAEQISRVIVDGTAPQAHIDRMVRDLGVLNNDLKCLRATYNKTAA